MIRTEGTTPRRTPLHPPDNEQRMAAKRNQNGRMAPSTRLILLSLTAVSIWSCVLIIFFVKNPDDFINGKICFLRRWSQKECRCRGYNNANTITASQIAIVTLNTGNDSDSYSKATYNHQSYATCHGYGFYNAGEYLLDKETQSVHPYMQKAFALKAIFQAHPEYEYIVWIDRDAIFMDHNMSILNRLTEITANICSRGDCPVGAGEEPFDLIIAVEPWAWLNSGVMVFRNTPFSIQLIEDWIKTYHDRAANFDSTDTIEIQGAPTLFRDLFGPKWSCEDQGALIALLAGYDQSKKWETDKYDGLGKPHLLHRRSKEWAALSSRHVLAPKYQRHVGIVAQEWLNTSPWDHRKLTDEGTSVKPFIFHFNGQKNKPELIAEYGRKVGLCSA